MKFRTECFQTNGYMQFVVEVNRGFGDEGYRIELCKRGLVKDQGTKKARSKERRTACPQHPQSWHMDCMCDKRRASGLKTCRSTWNRRRNSPVSGQDVTHRIHGAGNI